MEDFSHLKKESEHEEKGLINNEGGNPAEGRELLAKMKEISKLISDVCLISALFISYLTNLLLYRELSPS